MGASGFDERAFRKGLEKLRKDLRGDMTRAVARGLRAVAGEISRRAPVDTGSLLAGIVDGPVTTKKDVIAGEVTIDPRTPDDRDYLGTIEYGDRDTVPKPFIRPAIASKEPEVIRLVETALPEE